MKWVMRKGSDGKGLYYYFILHVVRKGPSSVVTSLLLSHPQDPFTSPRDRRGISFSITEGTGWPHSSSIPLWRSCDSWKPLVPDPPVSREKRIVWSGSGPFLLPSIIIRRRRDDGGPEETVKKKWVTCHSLFSPLGDSLLRNGWKKIKALFSFSSLLSVSYVVIEGGPVGSWGKTGAVRTGPNFHYHIFILILHLLVVTIGPSWLFPFSHVGRSYRNDNRNKNGSLLSAWWFLPPSLHYLMPWSEES